MKTLNTISIVNKSGLDPSEYTFWVAGYITSAPGSVMVLGENGKFSAPSSGSLVPYVKVPGGSGNSLVVDVPDTSSTGNNRLVFLVLPTGTVPAAYNMVTPYAAYPFPAPTSVNPPGPYDIFEFGPNAQYDVSAVDCFGLNLSFTVSGDGLVYGVRPDVTRGAIGDAFATFTSSHPKAKGFEPLLYTSPTGTGYPVVVDGQFSAIVSPKCWLAIHPKADGLAGYWEDTVAAFFKKGNQMNLALNAATVGTYAGTCDGTKYVLNGPDNLTIEIPRKDFEGNQPFIQAVRGKKTQESAKEYAAFGQLEAAMFQAFSRGVALDGVKPKGPVIDAGYTSKAWLKTENWFTDHANAYNGQPSVYDFYAKFLHYSDEHGKLGGKTIFGPNGSKKFGMAYGFSLDENPNVGDATWPSDENVPSKKEKYVGKNMDVTLTIGPWYDVLR
ncbi:beta-1,3-glucanase family protein [Thalassospira sp. TSL5-1]|uniref:beta-1,3-glucanase family protein n=1 Tax=Thalassospira sp. TSL5-1 TaxID=1544451 RepID=UPI00093B9473|nr:beta-1,3-glucanase family protein [Thalassospira sp. TSL5-1]OKH89574.1 hypothetical protein LF95_06380 [Thalassospira sp. TSL5-1]